MEHDDTAERTGAAQHGLAADHNRALEHAAAERGAAEYPRRSARRLRPVPGEVQHERRGQRGQRTKRRLLLAALAVAVVAAVVVGIAVGAVPVPVSTGLRLLLNSPVSLLGSSQRLAPRPVQPRAEAPALPGAADSTDTARSTGAADSTGTTRSTDTAAITSAADSTGAPRTTSAAAITSDAGSTGAADSTDTARSTGATGSTDTARSTDTAAITSATGSTGAPRTTSAAAITSDAGSTGAADSTDTARSTGATGSTDTARSTDTAAITSDADSTGAPRSTHTAAITSAAGATDTAASTDTAAITSDAGSTETAAATSAADATGTVNHAGAPAAALAVYETIILQFRLPRVIVAALVGCVLAVCGAVMQGVFRNPLADPYLLGIAAGATAGVAAAIGLGWAGVPLVLPAAAFAGGSLAVAIVYTIATPRGGGSVDNLTLILAGVALAALFSAVTALLLALAGERERSGIVFWVMGGLAGADWRAVGLLLPVALLGGGACLLFARELNGLALGDEQALHLGLDARRLKRLLLGVATLMTGVAVAVSGTIGFVGLIVPHAMRLVIGPDHRWLLPASALSGALFLIVADTGARVVIAPAELPVGIITAVCGGPFFLYLLRRRRVGQLGRANGQGAGRPAAGA